MEEDKATRVTSRIGKLALLESADLAQFIHSSVDTMIGRPVELDLGNAPKEAVRSLSDEVASLCRTIAGLKLDTEKARELLESKGVATPEAQKVFMDAILGRASDIRGREIESGEYAKTILSDFDWKVHLTLSSDKISGKNSHSCLLQLMLKDNGSSEERPLFLELTKDDLDRILTEFEAIDDALQSFKMK